MPASLCCDLRGYKQARYDEISQEMINMLQKVGWKKDFILKSTPVLPISGWMGDNLTKKSTNMPWWKGMDIEVADQKKGTEKLHVRLVLGEFRFFEAGSWQWA